MQNTKCGKKKKQSVELEINWWDLAITQVNSSGLVNSREEKK